MGKLYRITKTAEEWGRIADKMETMPVLSFYANTLRWQVAGGLHPVERKPEEMVSVPLTAYTLRFLPQV